MKKKKMEEYYFFGTSLTKKTVAPQPLSTAVFFCHFDGSGVSSAVSSHINYAPHKSNCFTKSQ